MEFKYLAIKNWDKYQPKNKKSYPWIRDYKEKDFDPEVSRLTVFQRGILDMCCRLRGRLAKNLSNDPQWIVSAVSIMSQERRNAISAIGQLVVKGFLVPTNQQDDSISLEGESKKRGDKEDKEPSAKKLRGIDNSKVAKATGETRHTRIQQIVMGWYFDWAGVECPWDGGEGANLKRMIDSTPNWIDSQFVTCLDNLARSDCIPKGDRPREWLEKLPKFLHGPLDQFWKAKGLSNGTGNNQSTAAKRDAANVEALVRSGLGARVQHVHADSVAAVQNRTDDPSRK